MGVAGGGLDRPAPRANDRLVSSILDAGGAIVSVASTAGMFWLENYDMARALVDTPTFEAGLEWFATESHNYDAYNLSKEAVILYTLLLGARREDPRIRCNVVSPGPVDTAILPDFEEHMGKDTIEFVRNVVGRHGTPDDIAPVIAFLAGPEAAWVDGCGVLKGIVYVIAPLSKPGLATRVSWQSGLPF